MTEAGADELSISSAVVPTLNSVATEHARSTSLPAADLESSYSSSNHHDSSMESLGEDAVEKDIQKWVEYYDQMKSYLQSTVVGNFKTRRRFSKPSLHFSLEGDGNLYYNKPSKDGQSVSRLLVIRNYEDRLEICKAIHLNTGTDGIHFRRDMMLAIVGQHYFWKGQRRDVCECIASCEICSTGLGGKRKTKPPRQARDVRPPSKLLKLSSSPLADNTTTAVARPQFITVPTTTTTTTTTTATTTHEHEIGLALELPNVAAATCATTCSSQSSTCASDEVGSSYTSTFTSASFQPIFTTIINEPIIAAEPSCNTPCASSLPIDVHVTSTPMQSYCSNTSSPSPSGLQNSSDSSSIPEEDSVSIYQSLFSLPSQPSDAIAPSVVNAMQNAMTHTVDPVKLREAAEMVLKHTLKLSNIDCTVLIAPSRAAAYVIAVAASMLRIDPLSVNQGIRSYQCSPMAVIHDACCQASGSLKSCTSLVGAYNWNLGNLTTPMDRKMLTMAVRNNRVAAVFHQPFVYLEQCQYLSLQVMATICHTHAAVDVAAIVDAGGMTVATNSLDRAIAEFFDEGADAVLLPETEVFSGPPYTCVLVAKENLLMEVSQNLSLLQTQVALPLTCPSYDIVGTVMALLSANEIS